ncbi:hypothetical protein RHGRI_003655 [Rhododendron griersonianum]|uniref:Uncharacterized protein n=1 Tax=Rhododendron griersonianum TaxID=479676 RepID=A0AAV6L834_9ERIC|nr:hypothetical protein RHGRI_003655 [Rhododendron griersonianum]
MPRSLAIQVNLHLPPPVPRVAASESSNFSSSRKMSNLTYVMMSIFAHQAPKTRVFLQKLFPKLQSLSNPGSIEPVPAQIIVMGPAMDKQLLVVGKLFFFLGQ